ncbi:hypothetical protein JNK13_10470 [bacterium]|nr:hypothetical protein [bacterium]
MPERIIQAEELASYVVCPESWRLKNISGKKSYQTQQDSRENEVRNIRSEWFKTQSLSAELRRYAKVIYYLLVAVVAVLMLWDSIQSNASTTQSRQLRDIFSTLLHSRHSLISTEILLILLIVGVLIFIWDLIDRRRSVLQKSTGLDKHQNVLEMKNHEAVSGMREAKTYTDLERGLSGKPDALIEEHGYIIPAIIRPVSTKVRDRHAILLTALMALIESSDKKTPPYGLMLLGRELRPVKIKNSAEKVRWLDTILDEMRSIEAGVPAMATPQYQKCKHCDVNQDCKFSAYKKTA